MVCNKDTIVCSICGRELPLSEYYSHTRERNGIMVKDYFPDCKECECKRRKMPKPIVKPKKTKESNEDRINRLQAEAAAHNMSYGRYVARYVNR